MTREALADRLVNYADAVAAFAVVNSLAFLLALTETEIRCSLASVELLVIIGQILVGFVMTLAVISLRRVELRLRASDPSAPDDVKRLLGRFYIVRIGVIWLSFAIVTPFVRMALSDSACLPPVR